jgi:hypothetical protein
MMNVRPVAACFLLIGFAIGGCEATRQQQLEHSADQLRDQLIAERDRVLSSYPTTNAERSPRLDHLSSLNYTLSAANVALGIIPRAVPEADRPIAYDVIEEVHSTIEWNIPLGPGDAKRPLPTLFQGNQLNIQGLQASPAARPRGIAQ